MSNYKNIGYDETKKMLNTLRKLNESKQTSSNLREQDENAQKNIKNDITVINDVDVKMLSSDQNDMHLSDEQKTTVSQLIDNFRQQVSQIVQFTPGMTINERQIRLDGTLTDKDISFVFIAGEENGLYINADMLKIEQDVIDIVSKLLKFEMVYKTAMEPLITQRQTNIK
jgi:hypothetical protein